MANSLYNKLAYMKAMINSTYGSGFQNLKTTYDDIYSIKKRINIIELRKYKIKKNMSDWEIGDCIWCYKEHLSLLPYRNYRIVGSGDLSMNADPNVGGKSGYGYCIEIEFLNEMDKYFVKNYNDIKSVIRDNKINKILKND
jgi:hypothetical protein